VFARLPFLPTSLFIKKLALFYPSQATFGLEEIRLKPLASLYYIPKVVPIPDFQLLEKSYLSTFQAFTG